MTEEELAGLPDFATGGSFSEREKAALAYAEAITLANTVSDPIFDRLRDFFGEDEIVELTAAIVWELAAAKFNRALEIEGQGICLLPGKAAPDVVPDKALP